MGLTSNFKSLLKHSSRGDRHLEKIMALSVKSEDLQERLKERLRQFGPAKLEYWNVNFAGEESCVKNVAGGDKD